MKKLLTTMALVLACSSAMATTLYVDLNSSSPTSPYSTWETAATDIQSAVDAAVSGDTVIATNGHYVLTSEILVEKAITIESMNGPEVTIVDGDTSYRCFNLDNYATVLSGLTVTNGNGAGEYAYDDPEGGGILCSDYTPIVTNCLIVGNTALRLGVTEMSPGNSYTNYYGKGGGMYQGTAKNCTISGNSAGRRGGGIYYTKATDCSIISNTSAQSGGGTYGGTVSNCTISGNTAQSGGGTRGGTVSNCTISGNTASSYGGGAMSGTLNDCTISGNVGGGAAHATLNACVISGNTGSSSLNGGLYACTANNCVISGNDVYGMKRGSATNCTIVANSGTGAIVDNYSGEDNKGLYNCIVYYNELSNVSVEHEYAPVPVYYCCSPELTSGLGNITNAPSFVDFENDDYRLRINSPCINAGYNAYVVGDIDLEENFRIVSSIVDIGAYENQVELDDSDADGMPDAWELDYFGSNADPTGDADSDGLSNLEEYENGTNPKDSDTDDDGLLDGDEVHTYDMDPYDPDQDNDGITDGWEVLNFGSITACDPLADDDADGKNNAEEFSRDTDPNLAEMTLRLYTAIELEWVTILDGNAQIQSKDSMTSTNWVDLGDLVPQEASGSANSVLISAKDTEQRYFRVIVP